MATECTCTDGIRSVEGTGLDGRITTRYQECNLCHRGLERQLIAALVQVQQLQREVQRKERYISILELQLDEYRHPAGHRPAQAKLPIIRPLKKP
jgi:hypothetical protein